MNSCSDGKSGYRTSKCLDEWEEEMGREEGEDRAEEMRRRGENKTEDRRGDKIDEEKEGGENKTEYRRGKKIDEEKEGSEDRTEEIN